MKDIAYYNGKIGRIDEVQAPITDRGFYFGDGVYDAEQLQAVVKAVQMILKFEDFLVVDHRRIVNAVADAA